jgi:hypothetical protein
MADLNPSVLVKGVGVNLMGLERSSWTLLNLRKVGKLRLLKINSIKSISLVQDSKYLAFDIDYYKKNAPD